MVGTAKCFIPAPFPSTLFPWLVIITGSGEKKGKGEGGGRGRKEGALPVSVPANESALDEWPPFSGPPSKHISVLCDFADIPIRRWRLFLQLLMLNWPCDLLWPTDEAK